MASSATPEVTPATTSPPVISYAKVVRSSTNTADEAENPSNSAMDEAASQSAPDPSANQNATDGQAGQNKERTKKKQKRRRGKNKAEKAKPPSESSEAENESAAANNKVFIDAPPPKVNAWLAKSSGGPPTSPNNNSSETQEQQNQDQKQTEPTKSTPSEQSKDFTEEMKPETKVVEPSNNPKVHDESAAASKASLSATKSAPAKLGPKAAPWKNALTQHQTEEVKVRKLKTQLLFVL